MGQVQSAFDPDSQVPVVYDNPPFPSLYNPTFDSTVDGEGYFLHDATGESNSLFPRSAQSPLRLYAWGKDGAS